MNNIYRQVQMIFGLGLKQTLTLTAVIKRAVTDATHVTDATNA